MDKLPAAIPNDVLKALCNTLFHSLWLGLLLALVAGLIVICTRRSRAQFRYNLLLALLALFASALMVVFISDFGVTPERMADAGSVKTPGYKTVSDVYVVKADVNYYTVASTFLNAHAGIIVTVWFLIVMARTLQLLTGLQSLYFLRRRHVTSIGDRLELRVAELARQLGIKRLVRVAESAIVKVPMVVGHLKPLILIPAGLITALPPAGIEAILVHELAHIRRRDYLVNLLMGILEIILFFNPAVLWVSSLIREERENCCDDIAIAVTGSKVDYIKALVSCREYQPGAPAYAMAFSGRKDHLLGRVKRMLHNRNPSLNVVERTILGASLLMAVVCTTAFSTAGKLSRQDVKVVKQKHRTITTTHSDTTRKKVTHAFATKLSMYKDVEQTVSKHDSATIHRDQDIRVFQPGEVGENTNITLSDKGLKIKLVKVDGVLYQLNTRQDHILSLRVNGITVAPGQYQPYLFLMDHATQHESKQLSPLNAKPNSLSPLKATIRPIQPMNAKTAAIDAKAYRSYPVNAYPQNYKPYTKTEESYHDGTARDRLAADLVAGGIIGAPGKLRSFKLSSTEFIVNGKKMPDDVFQQFKKAFVPEPKEGKKGDWSWMYNYDVSKINIKQNELLADSTDKAPVA